MKERIESLFLYQILEVDSEDSASIKIFLSVRWSGGKKWQLMVAINGRGWKISFKDFWTEFKEREREVKIVFYAEEHIYNL